MDRLDVLRSRMEGFRIFLPYQLQKLENGYWIYLNRLYKPLGMNTREHVIYETHPSAFRFAKNNPRLDFLYPGNYFYRDGCKPFSSKQNTDAYFEKLQKIQKFLVNR